ncbi:MULTISPECIES: hypothetical protein [unclassified Streptomyces]|uniref:hypothetical protein n=1 Tax=unclassified Streptomyces TaxID=2593676 RepID=UPI002E17BC6D|nr:MULTISPECIES: hypothetical protein [unclassified Streptomyces]
MSTRTQAIPSVVPPAPATSGSSNAAAMRRASRGYPARRVAPSASVTVWIAAHRQLGTPLLLVRDNRNVHLDAWIHAFITAQHWVMSFQLPSYAPDVNRVEGIRSLVRRTGQNHTAVTDSDHLMHALRRTLHETQN